MTTLKIVQRKGLHNDAAFKPVKTERKRKSLKYITLFDICSMHPSHICNGTNIVPVQGGNHAYTIDKATGNKRFAYVNMANILPRKREGALSWSIKRDTRQASEHASEAFIAKSNMNTINSTRGRPKAATIRMMASAKVTVLPAGNGLKDEDMRLARRDRQTSKAGHGFTLGRLQAIENESALPPLTLPDGTIVA